MTNNEFVPDPNAAREGFTAQASDDPEGVARDARVALTTSNTTADARAAEPAEHVVTVTATDSPEVGANEALLSFPDGSGAISVHVDAEGKPHVIVPLTKATKAKIGTSIAGVAIGAQFALDYIVPDDSPWGTAAKVALWAAGIVGTALGVYLPKNMPVLKAKGKH